MITYGFSQQGKSHIQKGVVCQDSHRIEMMENGWYILVVADGVGSARHSEDGSRIAVDMVARYCKKNIKLNMTDEQIIETLEKSYQIAFRQIELFCEKVNSQIEDYDTTLSVAIYTGRKVYFGHAGDGGIIVKDSEGHYEMITVPQKGVDGISVRPLRSGSDSWQFGITEKKIAAVLLATDGMLDTLLPPLLNINQLQDNPMMQTNKQMNVYVTLVEFFLNANTVYRNKEIKQANQFMESFLNCDISSEEFNQCLFNAYSYMFDLDTAKSICKTVEQYNYSIWKMDKVTDDRTIVCAINENELISAESPEYYAEPDWKVLQQQFDRLAYPSLYDENDLVQAGDYVKVSLTTNDNEYVRTQRKDTEKLELKTEGGENVSVPATRVASVQATKAYQSVLKKTKKNFICGLAVVLLVGGVIAGVKIIMDKLDYTSDFFSNETEESEESEFVISELEDEKLNSEKEDETEYSTIKKEDREEEIADNFSSEEDERFENQFESEETTSEQSNSEDMDDREFKTEIALSGEKFLFPCNLNELKNRYTLILDEENENYKIYSYSGTNIVVKVQTVFKKETSYKRVSGESMSAYSTELTEYEEEKVENISLTLRNNNGVTIQQNEAKLERVAEIYCDEKCVAELGMSQDEFKQSQINFERNTSINWTKEMRGYDYRLKCGDITYIIFIQDGIVCEMTLQLNKE